MQKLRGIGLCALLLVASACGSKSSSDDKKTSRDDEPTKKTTTGSSSSSGAAPSAEPTAKWERHSVAGASASFPKKPEPRTQEVDTPAGKMTVQMLTIEADDGTFYGLTVSQFPGPISDTATVLSSSQRNSWTKVTNKTLTESKLDKDGLPGFQLKFTNNEANTRPLAGMKRAFVDAKAGRLISAEAVANDKWDEKQALMFLDSVAPLAKP